MPNFDSCFITITENNKERTINDFCASLFGDSQYSDSVSHMNDQKKLSELINHFDTPFTIIQEFHHIDRSFRDSYYTYFSNQHFHINNFSRRLSFFQGTLTFVDYVSKYTECELQEAFMGSCVINPVVTGAIGRTLIAPQYILKTNSSPVYVRLAEFTVHIYGKKLKVKAFPYRMQDSETMRCAEVALLNLFDYYANSYNDYKISMPSEIIDSEQRNSYERVLPSQGMNSQVLTKAMSEFGFFPRLYHLLCMDTSKLSVNTKEGELKRILHYYIESGIPVILNLSPINDMRSGHSVVCIGHGNVNKNLWKDAKRNKWISWKNKDICHPLINSADLYDDYVIIDDNQPVYQIRNINRLSADPELHLADIAVPLYKRMFLDAPDASSIIRSILQDPQYGISAWANDFLKEKESVVMKLFMVSAHNLKAYRSRTLNDLITKAYYVATPMPRFVWVCELYQIDNYENNLAFAEVVIDATSAANRRDQSLILMHYQHIIMMRLPEQSERGFENYMEIENDGLFPGYDQNLDMITVSPPNSDA